jgi:hypothetical protein
MQRRHLEDTLARQLERGHLDDHRHRFEHEDAADDRQQQFLLDEDRDRAERAAERQRSHIAHEDVGGIGVVPEEAQARAHQRAAEDRQFACRRKPHE